MSTSLRVQPLAASTAMLAAEHARLDRAVEAKRKDLEMTATQVPTGDDLVRALAAEIRAEEVRTAAKREALARAENALRTQSKDNAEAQERARQQEVERQCGEIAAAQEEMLDAVEDAEDHLKAYVASINRAYAAEARRRKAANAMAGGVRLSMTVSLGKQYVTSRLVGGHCAHTAKVAAIDAVGRTWGALTLIDYAHYPTSESWRDREERATAADVERLIEHARGQ